MEQVYITLNGRGVYISLDLWNDMLDIYGERLEPEGYFAGAEEDVKQEFNKMCSVLYPESS